MGDEEGRHRQPLGEPPDLVPHLVSKPRIQVTERLIQQEHLRVAGQRPRQCDSLLLAPAEQWRRASLEALEAHQRQRLVHAAPNGFSRSEAYSAVLQRIGDVPKDVHVRPDGVRLEDHSQFPAICWHEDAPLSQENRFAVQLDPSRCRPLKSGDTPDQAGLAAAAWSQQRIKLSGGYLDGYPPDRVYRPFIALVHQMKVFNRNQRCCGVGKPQASTSMFCS